MVRCVAFVITLLFCGSAAAFTPHEDGTINAVIGDASRPVGAVSDVQRIQAHLRYVIAELRQRDTAHLSASQRDQRAALLVELEDYTDQGIFPRRSVGDGHGVRRPQFIDDRGVHCAVGELIRRSGHVELAASIDDVAEYEYVLDMRIDALDRWAHTHGFTATELAMIQPSYHSPPSRESVERQLVDQKDRLMMMCAIHPVSDQITVNFAGDRRGNVTLTGREDTPFAKCYFTELRKANNFGGGAWDSQPQPFSGRVKLALAKPRKLIEQRFEAANLSASSTECSPRPGALPRTAKVKMRVDAKAVSFDVTTEPANPEVAECLRDELISMFRDVQPGTGDFELEQTKDLGTLIHRELLEQHVPQIAKQAGLKCWAAGTPTSRQVTVTATPEAEAFEVSSTGGSAAFTKCFDAEVRDALRSNYEVLRSLPDGEYERYFRIDAAVTVKTTVELMTPAQKKQRDEEFRRKMDRHRYDP